MVSIGLGIATIRSNQSQRLAKIRPELRFDIGGQVIQGTVAEFRSFPGKDPEDPEVREHVQTLDKGAQCINLRGSFGRLFNHGEGTAYGVSIWFEPDRKIIDEKVIRVTAREQARAPNTKEWNTITSIPANIAPDAEGEFRILPASAYLLTKGMSQISGSIFIECTDNENTRMIWQQSVIFTITPDSADELTVMVSFGK